jgi:cysteinyl-tRNA synthetase
MSKSLGNLITIREALEKYTPDGLRIFYLSSYYRSPLTYTQEAIEAAQAGADRLQRVAAKETVGKGLSVDPKPYYDKFIEAMDDDFNTPQAIAALFDLARDINRAEENGKIAGQARCTLRELGGVLGLTFKLREASPLDVEPLRKLASSIYKKVKAANVAGVAVAVVPADADAIMTSLISARKELRKAKQFQLADEIRDGLTGIGITLEDTPQGTTWKRKY